MSRPHLHASNVGVRDRERGGGLAIYENERCVRKDADKDVAFIYLSSRGGGGLVFAGLWQ